MNAEPIPSIETPTVSVAEELRQISMEQIKSIHKSVDDSVDWTEVLCNPNPPDKIYNKEMWRYYHSVAGAVLSGDIDTYLQVIYEVNPLDDLLDYGTGFEFGTDNPKEMYVEFTVVEEALQEAKSNMSVIDYNELLLDFVSSTAIRIARDIFALLPVKFTVVHAMLDRGTILSVRFDRPTLSRIRFGYIDPSETIEKFTHSLHFQNQCGFTLVERLL